jgi:selenocysteine lyase/cysteine desulfurase
MTDIDRWRADTEGCAHRIHLNNAGASLMPRPVADAIREHIDLEERIGGYEASALREAEIAHTYERLATLTNASSRNIAIVANATAGFVQSMSSFDFSPGDRIVTTRSDYTSYQIHFLALAKRLGVDVIHANDLPEGGVDPDSVRDILRSRKTRLVHLSWVPTHSGLVQDAEAVGRVCEEEGVPYLVDACQAVGQMPVDVERLRCDYLTATARKFLRGPRGIGFMFASDRAMERGDYPLFVDMRGATWVSAETFEVAATAKRYEDWEFPYALVLGLSEAAAYASSVGVEAAATRARGLAQRLREGIDTIDGGSNLDPGREQCAIVTCALDGIDSRDAVRILSENRINASLSLRWYGLIDFTTRGVDSAIRLSPHYYNTEAEIDTALDILDSMRREA